MKQKKLPSLLALTICLELIVSPLAVAETSTLQTVMGGLQTGMGVYNSLRGGNQGAQNSYYATDMAAFNNQKTPAADKYFTLNNMQKIPGLMEYVAKKNQEAAASGGKAINPLSLNCSTLPTTLFESNTEVCRNKSVSTLASPDQQKAQATEAFAYYNEYLQIDKIYQNYSTRSNVGGQSFGTGCMEDGMEILKGFFAYRLEQLDTMVTEFEAAEARFVAQSEMDLKGIRESTAILNGEDSTFATEFKNTDIFNYGDRFADPACNSIMAKDGMDSLGKGDGLMGIEKKLKTDFTAVPEGSRYSPEAYLKNNAAIVSDIKAMANKVATQANLNFSQIASGQEGYSAFLNGLSSSVSSDTGVNGALNSSFFSDLQTKFTQTRNTLNNSMGVLNSELGKKGEGALSLVTNIDNDSNFEAQVKSLENSIKNECLSNSGLDVALSRIHDPELSKQANKHSANELAKKLKVILEDPNLTPESKVAQLKALNSAGGSRFQMRLDADFETKVIEADGTVNKKVARAASTTTAASFFTSLIQNCDTQFQVNKMGNQYSGKEAVNKLRKLKEDYKKAAKQNAQDIKEEITKKMIECNGNAEVASSTTVGSCSPATLSMANASFCTKAAFSCSSNMKSCTEKAQKVVKDLKNDRLKRTNNYNNNVEATRKQLVGMFDKALSKYMKEAESMRGMFGVGFTPPKDIVRDIKDGSQFDKKFQENRGDALEIKDPEQYLKMVKNNMASLRKQVEEQQKGIIGNDGNLQKHLDQTKENYKNQVLAKANKLGKECLEAYNNYSKMVVEQKNQYDKNISELGEKTGKFCGLYSDIMSDNPNGACKEDIRELASAASIAAQKAGRIDAYETTEMTKEMNARCAQVGVEADDAEQICLDPNRSVVFDKIFNERYVAPKTYVPQKGDNLAQIACMAVTSGEANDLCIAGVPTVVTLSKKPAKVPNGYSSCEEWEKDEDSKKYSAECMPIAKDCTKLEANIVAIYKNASKNGALNSNTQTNRIPSLCASSNNSSGNPKANQAPGSALGGIVNPMYQAQ